MLPNVGLRGAHLTDIQQLPQTTCRQRGARSSHKLISIRELHSTDAD